MLERTEIGTCGHSETPEGLLGIRDMAGRQPVQAVGIACGGPLDAERGIVLSPPNLPNWDAVPVVELFSEAAGAPAYLMNDANAGALAEGMFGAARGCEHYIFSPAARGWAQGRTRTFAAHSRWTDRESRFVRRLVQRRRVRPVWRTIRVRRRHCRRGRRCGGAGEAGRFGEQLGRGLAILVDLEPGTCRDRKHLRAGTTRFVEPAMRRILAEEPLAPALEVCRIVPAELGDRIGDLAALAVARYRHRPAPTALAGPLRILLVTLFRALATGKDVFVASAKFRSISRLIPGSPAAKILEP